MLIRVSSDSANRARNSRERSPRRRSRTPDRNSQYAGRYRSPIPYHQVHGSNRGCVRLDEDSMMKDTEEEEWLIRRAYESGRADERRRLQRAIMEAFEPKRGSEEDFNAETLIAL